MTRDARRAPATVRRRRPWKKMATAWANFDRTDNPTQPGLAWPAFTPERCPTMVFDSACGMVDDRDAEARNILSS